MSHFKSPDNKLHNIDPEFEFMLPVGSVPISDEEAQALIEEMRPPAPVPQSVTRFQARAALSRAGLFAQINELMLSFPLEDERRLAWEDAQEFRRTSPTMLQMAEALKLTEADLDGLFIAAAGIEA